MSDIKELTELVIRFRNERDWDQFHNLKDLALAISIEAGELLELFLWKRSEEVSPEKISEELADVFVYILLMSEKLGLDIRQVVEEKMQKNALKYPVDKAKGNAKKYDEL